MHMLCQSENPNSIASPLLGTKLAISIKHYGNIQKTINKEFKMFIFGIWFLSTACFSLPTLMLIDGLKINK